MAKDEFYAIQAAYFDGETCHLSQWVTQEEYMQFQWQQRPPDSEALLDGKAAESVPIVET